MTRRSPRAHRPSASMSVALLALFIALGGVGWAATHLSPGSVGTTALRDGAVTSSKLAHAAVGVGQIDAGQIQRRVTGTCGPTLALGAVERGGSAHCNSTLPREFGTANQVNIGSSAKTIATKDLPAGTAYLAYANPYAIIFGHVTGQQVEVDCTLSVGGASQTRSVIVEVGPSHRQLQSGMPLFVGDQAVASSATSVTLTCKRKASAGAAPSVSVLGAVSAIQTR
jgi:hypothetical protein